ncbi:MAG: DEAD/DEAH box helicase [Pseudonocardia sp.]|nr:DEAD/DEAH box helicase [Pseudonocardia sp.]
MSVDRLAPVLAHHIVNTLGWRTLRPLQNDAVEPLLAGDDAVLLAPTAGGKTEAAMFPLLTAMERGGWTGTSMLYVCPLKALLNNLTPRLETYAAWVGRSVAVWHGDVGASARRRTLREQPDVLLTTPESIEAMLVSTKVEHRRFFAGLRAIVVDEVHAFAGDDRGWHLLAVCERLTRIAGRPVQRVGLSATVGNPAELLTWLQGSGRGTRQAAVVAPPVSSSAAVDVELDHVGSVDNAATVLAALHRGEKRLVFCDSRALVEKLGAALRERGITTFLSHASLSVDERRRSEAAFSEARDCVIVSTSTLELGIDVGDLDRVVQINAPGSVASFLQRLGRSGRRAGSTRNCLFLALDERSLLWAAGLLRLWGTGYVEPVTPPPEPRHIVAQQLLARCLQEGAVGRALWAQEWNSLAPFDAGAEPIMAHLVAEGFVERDGELVLIGPRAEEKFGRRHFMGMTTVFTAPPQFTVIEGRREIGLADPSLLTDRVQGPRLLLLAGRSWRVTWIDWTRKRCFVEAVEHGGRARWHTGGVGGAGFALTRSVRAVLLGDDPHVRLTGRAQKVLADVRSAELSTVHPGGTVITARGADLRWWTWAGHRANATLAATLSELTDGVQRFDDVSIRLRNDLSVDEWRAGTVDAAQRLCLPEVDDRALEGLKFSEALPRRLAEATLAARLADLDRAADVLDEPVRFVRQ